MLLTGIKKIGKELTDAGRYSYSALCAISINHLFNNEWDIPFNEMCLKKILKNVELPKQVILHFIQTNCTEYFVYKLSVDILLLFILLYF